MAVEVAYKCSVRRAIAGRKQRNGFWSLENIKLRERDLCACACVHTCEKLLHDVLPREKCGLQSALLLYAFTSKMTFLDNRLV